MSAISFLESIACDLGVVHGVKGAAVFSRCERYRFALVREWCPELGSVAFVGLNPSTADQDCDDPTVRRCIEFARRWGFGSMFMLNAHGFRSTDPRGMRSVADAVGPQNEFYIRAVSGFVGRVVVAWGNHCSEEHQRRVMGWCGRPVLCFAVTKTGRPKHPLYVRGDVEPQVFCKK